MVVVPQLLELVEVMPSQTIHSVAHKEHSEHQVVGLLIQPLV